MSEAQGIHAVFLEDPQTVGVIDKTGSQTRRRRNYFLDSIFESYGVFEGYKIPYTLIKRKSHIASPIREAL